MSEKNRNKINEKKRALDRRGFLKRMGSAMLGAGAVGLAGNPLRAQGNGKSRRPNIILLFADDMGYGDAGCYGDTNLVPMPNVDRLAREGVRFTDGYVTAPVCGPSRYGLLAGAYQQRFGIQWNPDAWGRIPGMEETQAHNRIPSNQKLLHETLSDNGYVTGIVGKWNLPNYPKTTFDETMSVMHFGGDYWPDETGHYGGVNEPVPTSNFKDVYWGPKREGDQYLTDVLGDQSVDFINRHADEPFFLYLSFNAPHSPLQAKKVHQKAVAHLESEAQQYYGAMLLSMDENIGKVLDALDQRGLAENTLVAFSSDNGPTRGYTVDWPEEWPKVLLGSTGPLRGHKAQHLEGGIRVPYIMRWPAGLNAGQVYKKAVSTLDYYPTFCAAAGVTPPEETILDGVNLLPYLRDKKSGSPHEMLFWHSYHHGAVRSGEWKLYVYKDKRELYNLREDIGETTNVSGKHPEIFQRLSKAYDNFAAPLPPPVNPYK